MPGELLGSSPAPVQLCQGILLEPFLVGIAWSQGQKCKQARDRRVAIKGVKRRAMEIISFEDKTTIIEKLVSQNSFSVAVRLVSVPQLENELAGFPYSNKLVLHE
jgi:hypothetical protein